MADIETISNPAEIVFLKWGSAMKKVVGKGHYSMDDSATIATTPYAKLRMLGNPGRKWDLEGNESATTVTFEVQSFADGQTAIGDAYDIDAESHKVMSGMRFRRTYGPQLITNANTSIKRVVSRYSRVYSGYL